MSAIAIEVNNQRKIVLSQAAETDGLEVTVMSSPICGKREAETHYKITPGDFIMLLNWYGYQKRTGNKDLMF